jgi:hypothetical protein
MIDRYSFRHAFAAAFAVALFFGESLSARDVLLDNIYIKKESSHLARLSESKADALRAASARKIDSGVAFCGWSTGSALLYVKDEDTAFSVYEYYLTSGTRRFVAKGRGAVVYASVPSNGKYVLVKSLVSGGKSAIPSGLFSVVSVRTGAVKEYSARSQFIDFSATAFGASYVCEGSGGIEEIYPENASNRIVLSRERYARLMTKNQAVVPFLSPDASTVAVLNGGGGRYRAYFFKDGNISGEMDGVNTASEFVWIDSRTVAYRVGSPGNYFPALYFPDTGKSVMIGKKTMNTNISYSPVNGIVSYLLDGCVSFRSMKDGNTETYPVEVEDVIFSSNGNSFCGLNGGNLYVMQRETLKIRNVELRRVAAETHRRYLEALRDSAAYENDFSREYLERKVELYGELSGK